jgi:hypothetical protein
MKDGRHRWSNDRGAISGAVTAVMLLLIITSVLSIMMSVYVPVWGEADEADHMRTTLEQFYSLRENIDAQVLRDTPVTASTKLTLGLEPNALFGMSKTTGRIVSNPFNGSLAVYNSTDPSDVYARCRGNITFMSQNSYQAQQTYIYEQGAVLVASGGMAAMRAPPHFGVAKDSAGNLSVSILFVSLGGDFQSTAGTDNVILETKKTSSDHNIYEGADWELGKDLSINMSTRYVAAWAKYYNDTLGRPTSGLMCPTNYNVTAGINWVRLDIFAVRHLDIAIAIIEVRIR